VRALEESLRSGCERGDFRVVEYSIQREHLHALVEADDARALGRGMKSLGTRLAWTIKRVFGRTGRVLADRYHVHVLRTPREVRNAIAYVLNNARKHAVELGRRVLHSIDPASSGRWFSGWSEPVPAAHDPPAVASPRSWLLRVGWLRHGLVSISEIPGRRVVQGP
jgi:REP element-mobilizing transposase RayT